MERTKKKIECMKHDLGIDCREFRKGLQYLSEILDIQLER